YLISRRSTKFRVFGAYGDQLATEGDHGNELPLSGRNPGLALYATGRKDDSLVLLMSGIPSTHDRNLRLTCSTDAGRSWLPAKSIGDLAWYSDIGVMKDGTILVAYTISSSADLKVARCNLPWVTAK